MAVSMAVHAPVSDMLIVAEVCGGKIFHTPLLQLKIVEHLIVWFYEAVCEEWVDAVWHNSPFERLIL